MHLFARDHTFHHWTRSWLAHGDSFLRANWHWSHAQCQRLHASLSPVTAPSYWRAALVTPSCSTRASPLALTGPADPCGPVRPFSTPYAWAHLGLTPSILSPLFRTVKYPRTAAFLPYRPFLGPTAAVGRPDRAVTLSESDSADALVLYFAGRPRRHHIFPLPPAPPSSHAYDGPDPLHPVANAQIHVTSAAPPGPRPALLHAAPTPPESRPVSPFEAATAA